MPNDPPEAESVVEFPEQIVVVPEIDAGAVDDELIVTAVLTQLVVLHVPEMRTKYVVLELGETVSDELVPKTVPEQPAAYH